MFFPQAQPEHLPEMLDKQVKQAFKWRLKRENLLLDGNEQKFASQGSQRVFLD